MALSYRGVGKQFEDFFESLWSRTNGEGQERPLSVYTARHGQFTVFILSDTWGGLEV